MANYNFKCTACNNVEEKEIPMNQLSELKDKQICSVCGSKSERVWEPWSGTSLCKGMYGIDGKKGWTG